MADPRLEYQKELQAYGLGLGGIGPDNRIGAQRSPFAEEGPASGGFNFDEGFGPDDALAGLSREESMDYLSSMGIDVDNPVLGLQELVGRAEGRPETVLENIPSDISDFGEFSDAYGDVMSAIDSGPAATSSSLTPNQMEAALSANTSAMDLEGPEGLLGLDDIATTLAELSANPMAAGQAGAAVDSPILTEGSITQDQADEGFLSAMDDYLDAARGSGPGKPKERTIEEYKKAFSEATGIDTSGKVDKKDALMAFGLALMQNKAGKGFNVGKMLTSVGEAGDKALPALTKAKAEAKKAGLAAGQYALTARNSDRAKDEVNAEKARQRSDYYIVPKSKGVSGFLANMDEGQLEKLNSFELDALMTNKSFQEKFDVLPSGTWSGIVAEAMKTKEAEALYLTKDANRISLIPGVDNPLFTVKTFSADPNVAGNEGRPPKLDGDGTAQYRALAAASQDLGRAQEKFAEALGLAEGVSAFKFTLDKVDSLAGAFGINVDGEANDTEKLKLFLNKLKAQNAKGILGEAGKTISDADRALVESIVGNISVLQSRGELTEKMNQLYTDIFVKKQRDLVYALETMDRLTNRNIASRLNNGELNEEEYAELQEHLAGAARQESK